MILSDHSIRLMLQRYPNVITPTPEDSAIQPASVDLRLGNEIVIEGKPVVLPVTAQVELTPGRFMLAHTMENVSIPHDVVARVEGKSTWGRKGLMIHSTAGFIDPGFEGQITLEMYNLSGTTIRMQIGQPIAQICFSLLTTKVLRPYGNSELKSKYQNQGGATPAR